METEEGDRKGELKFIEIDSLTFETDSPPISMPSIEKVIGASPRGSSFYGFLIDCLGKN